MTELAVDVDALRAEVREKYREVAAHHPAARGERDAGIPKPVRYAFQQRDRRVATPVARPTPE